VNLLNHIPIVKVFAIQTQGESTMTGLFQRCANYFAHAIVLTAGLALIQPSASAQVVASNDQPLSESADSLIGDNMEIGITNIGGPLLPEDEVNNLAAIEQVINDSLELEFSDRLVLPIGNFELESLPQPEQIIFVRPSL
jgi:hypothetical protein